MEVLRDSSIKIQEIYQQLVTDYQGDKDRVFKEAITALVEKKEGYRPIVLGSGDLLVKNDIHGRVQFFKAQVSLKEIDKDLYELPNGKVDVTLQGIRKMNKITCLSDTTSEKQFFQGQWIENPYVKINPKTNVSELIRAKAYAIGFTPTGNIVVSTATIVFNPHAALLQQLIQEISSNKDAGGFCSEEYFYENVWINKQHTYFFPVRNDLGLWADWEDDQISKVFARSISNEERLDRKVLSMAKRNALKSHPTLAIDIVIQGDKECHYAEPWLIGATNKLTASDIKELTEQSVEAEEKGLDGFKVGGEHIDLKIAEQSEEVVLESVGDSLEDEVNRRLGLCK